MSPTPNVDAADAALLREKLKREENRHAELVRMMGALSAAQSAEASDLRSQIPVTRRCLAAAEGNPRDDYQRLLARWRMAGRPLAKLGDP